MDENSIFKIVMKTMIIYYFKIYTSSSYNYIMHIRTYKYISCSNDYPNWYDPKQNVEILKSKNKCMAFATFQKRRKYKYISTYIIEIYNYFEFSNNECFQCSMEHKKINVKIWIFQILGYHSAKNIINFPVVSTNFNTHEHSLMSMKNLEGLKVWYHLLYAFFTRPWDPTTLIFLKSAARRKNWPWKVGTDPCSHVANNRIILLINCMNSSQIEVPEHSNCRLVPYWREFLGVSGSRTWSDTPFANT